jgi:C-terminal processing protease CtpA/Prc
MARSVLVAILFLAIGAAAGSFVMRQTPAEPARDERHTAAVDLASARTFSVVGEGRESDRSRAEFEKRLARLEARVADEAGERQRLQERLDSAVAQLAARAGAGDDTARAPSAAAETSANDAANAIDSSRSAMERALAAAGLDAATAADIKRRQDARELAEINLRNQATREQWLDSPRFAEALAAIEAERTSVRDEIGDGAYDRYLFALGEPNRIRVDDVLAQSPAAEAGVQAGDMIVSYGDTRLFAPDELVAETRSGTAGEAVRLEIIRDGERLDVEVPRGPLGLRIAAAHSTPDAS